ncbi:hypothetical protein X798_02316 [Onchocerca flexuosa]|uniref:Uncharacterized protein n=1 Tax=Onchocerca flexuosa TaxID=387005 RepID=A0A238BZ83_9BILA|nr:hypothetical protein X798_02316 [Onchocerca flexuosa]
MSSFMLRELLLSLLTLSLNDITVDKGSFLKVYLVIALRPAPLLILGLKRRDGINNEVIDLHTESTQASNGQNLDYLKERTLRCVAEGHPSPGDLQ